MKLQALIIDDEPLAHKVILEYARDIPFLEIDGQCYLATEALSVLSRRHIDLIFLDINLPKIKGLDFLRTLPNAPIVIITSAYEEYALESFELDVCDYLLKPFRFNRFLKAANKALALHRLQYPDAHSTAASPEPAGSAQPLFIKSDKKLIRVEMTEVHFLEGYGNYVKVWLHDTFHLTPRTLASFEPELPGDRFVRIHKSYIINRDHIDYLEGNSVVLKNGSRLSIGKSYRHILRRLLS